MQKQKGFTLIELVMVIVVLGILAVTAMPKFVNFKADAQSAALGGVAGGINSASEINYATRSMNPASGVATNGSTCLAAASAVLNGGLPAGYTLSNAAPLIVSGVNTCTLTQTGGGTTTVSIIGI